jgi:hypothetical protein
MTDALGADQAKIIADQHENAGQRSGQPNLERQMDEANNDAGRCAGQDDRPGIKKSCRDKCWTLLTSGRLFGPGGKPMPAGPWTWPKRW